MLCLAILRNNDTPPPMPICLPSSVSVLADVVGRDLALRLAAHYRDRMYVPRRLRPGHPLISILGDEAAAKLVKEWGGINMRVANCSLATKGPRDDRIRELAAQGMDRGKIAMMFGLSRRMVEYIIAAAPPRKNPEGSRR